MIFCAGFGMLSLSIALNAISVHGACTAIFVVVAAVAVCFISSIQTLGKIQLLGYIGVASIVVAREWRPESDTSSSTHSDSAHLDGRCWRPRASFCCPSDRPLGQEIRPLWRPHLCRSIQLTGRPRICILWHPRVLWHHLRDERPPPVYSRGLHLPVFPDRHVYCTSSFPICPS